MSVVSQKMRVWVNGDIVEDVCWLQLEVKAQHINLVKLHAVLKGVNLALQGKLIVLYLVIDSVCIHHHWIIDTLIGKA